MTQPAGTAPLEKTFRFLVRSNKPNAPETIAYAVLNSRGAARDIALRAALDRPERSPLEAIIKVFADIPADLQAEAIARADSFLPILRQGVKENDRTTRANVCDFLVRMDDARVAYLLADLLQDPADEVRKKAEEGLLALANSYHAFVADIERGAVTISKQVLETKRYSLLDALLTALRFYKNHERPEMIGVLLSLDPRSDEVLLDVAANALDRRQKILLDILSIASYPRAIAFILSMLKNARTTTLAAEILEKRSDLAFVTSLLSAQTLFSNTRITAALGQVRIVPWMKADKGCVFQLPPRLAVRAVRYLIYAGMAAEERRVTLARLAGSSNAALSAAAKFVATAESHQVSMDKIDAGLVKFEERCPIPARTVEPAGPKAGTPAQARKREGLLQSDEALFRDFLSSFDTFGRNEREAAIGGFVSRGVFLRELKRALADPSSDVILRAIKVVEYKGCQAEVSSEMALLTRNPDAKVRSGVVRQLGKAGAYEAVKALFETLADRDRRVLANAIEGLEATGYRQVLRYLEPLFKHPDNRIRANAAKAAWTLGDENARQVLVDMLSSRKAEMRLSALWALRQIGVRGEATTIREIAATDDDDRVRKSAHETLADMENVP